MLKEEFRYKSKFWVSIAIDNCSFIRFMAIIYSSTVDVSFSYRQDCYVLLEGYFSDANCAVSQLSMVPIRDKFGIENLFS
jgi:hypothetical protein